MWLPDRLPRELKIVWRAPLRDIALAGVTATETRVLVADRELNDTLDVFRCLDAATGKEQWATRYPAPGALDYGNSPRAAPLIDGERVFLAGAHGHLRCVELATGRLIWQRDIKKEFGVVEELPWGFCGSPLLVDGKLIVAPGGPQASVVALDPATGKTIWQTPGKPASYGSLVALELGGKLQIVGHDETTLGGWDVESGKRLWTITPEAEDDFNVPTPMLWNKKLVVVTEGAGIRVFEPKSAGHLADPPVAEFVRFKPDTHTPVIVGNRLFGTYRDLYCIDLADGLKVVYQAKDKVFRAHTSLFATDERVLVCCDNGELILLDAQLDRYEPLGRAKIFEDEDGLLSHPALVGTRLYIRGSREIVCVDLAAE